VRLRSQLARDRRVPADDERAGARHEIDEALEREAIGDLVAVDVGVIELDVGHHRRPRQVVPHLRAFVEVRGVVLVGLDAEVFAVGQTEGRAEVLGDAADQKRRVEPGALEQPGEDRRRRRLAVRTGDGDDVSPAQELLLDHGGRRRVRNAPLEQRFELVVPAADRVADDHHVRDDIEVVGRKLRGVLDAQLLELRRHGRVDRGVRAGDAVPLRAQQSGE
jgi:hypothetical protein